jgi:hypothetical protein
VEHKEPTASARSRLTWWRKPGQPPDYDGSAGLGWQEKMATVIPLHRRRLTKTLASQKAAAAAAEHSAERFWRESMVPASILMGVIIVLALAGLIIVVKTDALGHKSAMWVLVAALVSVIGLTKIVIANMFFFLLMQDDARLNQAPAPPGPPASRQTRLLRMPPRPVARPMPRGTARRGRLASLRRD